MDEYAEEVANVAILHFFRVALGLLAQFDILFSSHAKAGASDCSRNAKSNIVFVLVKLLAKMTIITACSE